MKQEKRRWRKIWSSTNWPMAARFTSKKCRQLANKFSERGLNLADVVDLLLKENQAELERP
jgi:hypothetical protein